jgi:hypothetical protein
MRTRRARQHGERGMIYGRRLLLANVKSNRVDYLTVKPVAVATTVNSTPGVFYSSEPRLHVFMTVGPLLRPSSCEATTLRTKILC